jgi:hypothetical protein
LSTESTTKRRTENRSSGSRENQSTGSSTETLILRSQINRAREPDQLGNEQDQQNQLGTWRVNQHGPEPVGAKPGMKIGDKNQREKELLIKTGRSLASGQVREIRTAHTVKRAQKKL